MLSVARIPYHSNFCIYCYNAFNLDFLSPSCAQSAGMVGVARAGIKRCLDQAQDLWSLEAVDRHSGASALW